MPPSEPPVSKTESKRALWVAIVLFVIIGLIIAVILIAPSGPHDKPGADDTRPAAADPVANGAMTGRTTPVTP